MTSPSDFLIELQIAAARGAARRGLDLEAAAEHGTALAQAFADALKDGTLQDLGWVEETRPSTRQTAKPEPEQLRLEAA